MSVKASAAIALMGLLGNFAFAADLTDGFSPERIAAIHKAKPCGLFSGGLASVGSDGRCHLAPVGGIPVTFAPHKFTI